MLTYRCMFHFFLWQRPQSGRKLPPGSGLPGFSALVRGFSRGWTTSAASRCARWQRWCLQWTGELWDWNLHKQGWWNHRGCKIYYCGKIPDIIKVGNERCFCCFFTSTRSFLWEISSMSVFPFLLFCLEPCTQHRGSWVLLPDIFAILHILSQKFLEIAC